MTSTTSESSSTTSSILNETRIQVHNDNILSYFIISIKIKVSLEKNTEIYDRHLGSFHMTKA